MFATSPSSTSFLFNWVKKETKKKNVHVGECVIRLITTLLREQSTVCSRVFTSWHFVYCISEAIVFLSFFLSLSVVVLVVFVREREMDGFCLSFFLFSWREMAAGLKPEYFFFLSFFFPFSPPTEKQQQQRQRSASPLSLSPTGLLLVAETGLFTRWQISLWRTPLSRVWVRRQLQRLQFGLLLLYSWNILGGSRNDIIAALCFFACDSARSTREPHFFFCFVFLFMCVCKCVTNDLCVSHSRNAAALWPSLNPNGRPPAELLSGQWGW